MILASTSKKLKNEEPNRKIKLGGARKNDQAADALNENELAAP
jgi:hypothetical protein